MAGDEYPRLDRFRGLAESVHKTLTSGAAQLTFAHLVTLTVLLRESEDNDRSGPGVHDVIEILKQEDAEEYLIRLAEQRIQQWDQAPDKTGKLELEGGDTRRSLQGDDWLDALKHGRFIPPGDETQIEDFDVIDSLSVMDHAPLKTILIERSQIVLSIDKIVAYFLDEDPLPSFETPKETDD